MKLCIDALASSKLPGTSLFSYSREIITYANQSNSFEQIFALWDSFPLKHYWERLTNVNYIPLSIDRTSSNFSELIKFLEENQVDIYHSPNNGFSIPKEKCCKYISTIHSVYPITHKDAVNEKYYNKFISLVPNALENSDKIITLSEFTKGEIINNFNVVEDKIDVIPPKISSIFNDKGLLFSTNFIKKHYDINFPFILFVGSITEKKMLDKVLLLLKEIHDKDKSIHLVIAGDYTGKRDDYYSRLKTLIAEYMLEDNVHFLGLVKYSHIPVLYSAAICTIDFSDYNDYPLSAMEAIYCNSIVICNKTEANTSILDKAAIFASFDDFNSIADLVISASINFEIKEKINSMLVKPTPVSDDKILSIYEK